MKLFEKKNGVEEGQKKEDLIKKCKIKEYDFSG